MNANGLRTLLGLAVLAAAGLGAAPEAAAGPRELGTVGWERSFETGLAEAARSGRPVFLLFQEVPGCSTCVGFGETVLSDPLMVEAIETEFVPVAIFNNRPGDDARVLKRFGEPPFNNPVVRFVDAEGRDLIPREPRVWSKRGVAARMGQALRAAGRPVPPYLALLAGEAGLDDRHRVTFETHCFWEGEACAGALEGVLATRAGWLGGREVVELWFDDARTSYAGVVERLARRGCARRVFAHDDEQQRLATAHFGASVARLSERPRPARESDQQYYLRQSRLGSLPLTDLQRVRVNAALRHGQDPTQWLSPRQQASEGRRARRPRGPTRSEPEASEGRRARRPRGPTRSEPQASEAR